MSTRVQAKVVHHFSAPPERVFDAWLDPERVRGWLRAALVAMGLPGTITTVTIDPRVGGAFEFADLRPEGEARHWGTYLSLERPRSLSFTWITDPAEEASPSVVTVSITPEGSGCVVELVHDLPAQWKGYVERTEQGWSRMLAAIAAQAPAHEAPAP